MDLDLLAPKQVDRNKTYFQFLTELFFRRVGNRPKIKLEKFLFGIRPNCNIGTLELDLRHFSIRSNSEYQKNCRSSYKVPFSKHFFHSSFDAGICMVFERNRSTVVWHKHWHPWQIFFAWNKMFVPSIVAKPKDIFDWDQWHSKVWELSLQPQFFQIFNCTITIFN